MPIGRTCIANETCPFCVRCTVGLLITIENEQVTIEKNNDQSQTENNVDRSTGSSELSMPEEKLNI